MHSRLRPFRANFRQSSVRTSSLLIDLAFRWLAISRFIIDPRRWAFLLALAIVALSAHRIQGQQVCPCSIWSLSAVPGPMDSEAGALELGVKFRADVHGSITGLRFYKYAQNTGTHVGNLWTTSGHAARDGDVHQRDGVGVAAGDVRDADRHHGQHDLRRVVPHQHGLLRGQPTRL